MLKGLSKADILSRIFLLSDFTTNGGNIGFVLNDNLSDFRIIDFVIPEIGGAYEIPGIFRGFLLGNGRHCFSTSVDSLMRYVLCGRHVTKRVQTARESIHSRIIKRTINL